MVFPAADALTVNIFIFIFQYPPSLFPFNSFMSLS